MGYLKYARPAILIVLAIWFLLLIHPFTKEGVVITEVEAPASLVLRERDIISSVNGNNILTLEDYENAISQIEPNDTVSIVVLRETFPYTYREISHLFVAEERDNKTFLGIVADKTHFSNLRFSHKLIGGNKFIISTNQSNAIEIIKERLEINKVHDYSISKEGDKIILITTAGEEIVPLLETKGEFYAKVDNKIFFTTKDIKNICITGVDCALNLYPYMNESKEESTIIWRYGFEVSLTKEASQRFANLTKDLSIASCKGERCTLNATIDYYIDGKLIGSEEIYASNKELPYDRPIVGGAKLTKEDAMKALYFTQAMLKGGLDAKVEEIVPVKEKQNPMGLIVYVMIGIVIASAIVSFVFLRKIKILFAGMLLGFSEIVIVIGAITGLNMMITISTLVSLIIVSLITFGYQNYITYKLKKEGIIKSKIVGLSKKINKWMIIAIIVSFALVFFFSSFISPILIQLIIILVLTKSLFIKTIESA